MHEIAEISKHLTPKSLRCEMEKFPADVPIHLYHMKPPTLATLEIEIAALGSSRIRILRDDDRLSF